MTAQRFEQACPDTAALMEMAQAQSGLDDFGDNRLNAPLDSLVYSFQKDAWRKMTPASRVMAGDMLVGYLARRQRVVADRKRYPEIAKVKIRAPFIVVGPGRSGSTLLHTLLAMDPENIASPYWVCHEPSPPPALGEPTAARMEAADTRVRNFYDTAPDIYHTHSYMIEDGANALAECGHEIMVMAQTSKGLWYFYPIDSYRDYLMSADHSAALNFHHDFLQHVQWGREDKRWALKAADHMVWLGYLHAQYPDANLLWTHRDLSQLFSSLASVMNITRMISGPVPADTRRDLARQSIELERRIFDNGLETRAEMGEDRFCDVSYHDMMADPLKTMERIYDRFGLTVCDQHADNIRGWVAANPQTKHGVHKHSPEDFGFDADTVNRLFGDYLERFGYGFNIRPPLTV